jgi:hypothetical protein
MNTNRFNCLDKTYKEGDSPLDWADKNNVLHNPIPPKKGRFDSLKEEPSRPPRRFYNSRKNSRFGSLKPPELNSRFNSLQEDVLRSPKHKERFGSLRSLKREPPRMNSRFESLKPVEEPFREQRRDKFRSNETSNAKFEKMGSMEGMFDNLSIKPKQNKKNKKKKKKKQEVVYKDDEKDKEDKLLTIRMAKVYMYHTDEEEEEEVQEDNSAW